MSQARKMYQFTYAGYIKDPFEQVLDHENTHERKAIS